MAAKLDKEIDVFKRVSEALFELENEADKQRVLRAVAILAGFEFIENETRARRR